MKSYQFIIMIGSSFGILLNGLSLSLLLDSQLNNDSYITYQVYLLITLVAIYIANIIIAITLVDKSKIVGVISIVSAIAIAVLLIPIPPGPFMSAVLLIGGILAIIRKPEQVNPRF